MCRLRSRESIDNITPVPSQGRPRLTLLLGTARLRERVRPSDHVAVTCFRARSVANSRPSVIVFSEAAWPLRMKKAGSRLRDPAFRLTLGLLSGLANVGGLEPLRAPRHFELDLVTLGQALEALGLDGAEVHEHVLAVFLGDKAIPLRIVEPLHASLSHFYDLFL